MALLVACSPFVDESIARRMMDDGRKVPAYISAVDCGAAHADQSRDCKVSFQTGLPVARTKVHLQPSKDFFPGAFIFQQSDEGSDEPASYRVNVSTSLDDGAMDVRSAAALMEESVLLVEEATQSILGEKLNTSVAIYSNKQSYVNYPR